MHLSGTFQGIFAHLHPSAKFDNLCIDLRAFLQEEPHVVDVTGSDALTQGAELVGKHIRKCHHPDICPEQRTDFIVIRIFAVAHFHLQHTLALAIIEHQNRSVVLHGFVVNGPELEQQFVQLAIDIFGLCCIQQIKIQVRRKTCQSVKEHKGRSALKTKQFAQFRMAEDGQKHLYQVVSVFVEVHTLLF